MIFFLYIFCGFTLFCHREKSASRFAESFDHCAEIRLGDIKFFRKAPDTHKLSSRAVNESFVETYVVVGQFPSAFHTFIHYTRTILARYTLLA